MLFTLNSGNTFCDRKHHYGDNANIMHLARIFHAFHHDLCEISRPGKRLQSAKFPAGYVVFEEKGRRHPYGITLATGRAAGFEQGRGDMLGLGDGQYLTGAPDKLGADIQAVCVNNCGSTSQYIMAVSADQVGGCTRGGQSAELFRTNGYPVVAGQEVDTAFIRLASAVVTGA